ncbi:MAG: DinB family protein [Candidatus Limnocylindria bacterium]
MTPTRAVERLVRAAVGLTDAQLGTPWAWHEYDEEGLRFALLMAHQELRDLTATIADERARTGPPLTIAQRILGQYHDAYRDLTGALAGLRDDELDREPAPGEWPVRSAIQHMLGAESGFRTSMVLAVRLRRAGERRSATDDERKALNVPEQVGGDRGAVLDGLFRSHVRILRELSDVRDEEVGTPSEFWEDTRYPVRFRLHRLEEHMRQHTVQVDKTLAGIGHPPSEAERLARLVYQAVGGLEAAQIGAPGIASAAQERSAAVIAGLAGSVETGAATA